MNKKLYPKGSFSRMNYIVFYPEGRTPDECGDLPLITYLHGAGERGDDSSHLFRHAIPKLIEEGREYEAVFVCPQCPAHLVWDNVPEEVKSVIDSVAGEFHIKSDRISITGSSMGGFGTWMISLTYPNFFAASAPVAGGGMAWRCPNLINTPVYAYHGEIDPLVPVMYSELMVNAVNAAGGKATLEVLKDFSHNDGIDEAYRNTDLIEKLINARRDMTLPAVKEIMSEHF